MEDYYLGYVFTDMELQVLSGCMGIENSLGLPIKEHEITADEEMQTIRQLLRKNVLKWSEEDGYVLDPKFNHAFSAMKNSGHSLSLISKNYSVNGYVCFPGEPVVIWEISGYMENRFILLMFEWEKFEKMLAEEEFIPDISEYCGKFPDNYDKMIVEAIETAQAERDFSEINFSLVAKKTGTESSSYVIAGSEAFGNYLAYIENGNCTLSPYSKSELAGYIKDCLSEEE